MLSLFLCLFLALNANASEESIWVSTKDGADVVLTHRPAAGSPVIVLHGISSNHRCWDLPGGPSLARWLRQEGFDPWLLDLRGHGTAQYDRKGRRQWLGGSVDDYGLLDLPAAIDHVLRETGAEKVHFVGHSMGGLVVSVALSGLESLPIDRMVVVGTPMDFSDPDFSNAMLLRLGRLTGGILGFLPSPIAARFHSRFGSPFPVDEMLFTDISSPTREAMYTQVVSPLFGREIRQLEFVTTRGLFLDESGSNSYLDSLASVTQPTLVIAGRGDRVAPPDRVYGFYDALGSHEKTFVIAGRATGFSVDYGHLDLPLGDRAEQEIFPLISDWLKGPQGLK
jgi:polyhydroxyalkanoate synthase